jgi:hypothetical protein
MSINLTVKTSMPFWLLQTPTDSTEYIIGGWKNHKGKRCLKGTEALAAIQRYKDWSISCYGSSAPRFCYENIVHKCNWILFMKPVYLEVSYI